VRPVRGLGSLAFTAASLLPVVAVGSCQSEHMLQARQKVASWEATRELLGHQARAGVLPKQYVTQLERIIAEELLRARASIPES
jgi:hypothetical protein